MADCGRQLHTTITIGSQFRQQCVNCGELPTITREMPRLPVYIPAGDAREDGLIFKQAYAASLFEVGR